MSHDFQPLTAEACEAEIYPAGPPVDSAEKVKFGVCLSGGGSRALTCALGQLSALTSQPDPSDPGRTLLERADYLSSVSGGSWAAVLFTFLPATIDGQEVSDDDFLIAPSPPAALTKSREDDASPTSYQPTEIAEGLPVKG